MTLYLLNEKPKDFTFSFIHCLIVRVLTGFVSCFHYFYSYLKTKFKGNIVFGLLSHFPKCVLFDVLNSFCRIYSPTETSNGHTKDHHTIT